MSPSYFFSVTVRSKHQNHCACARIERKEGYPLEYGDQTVSIQSRLLRKWRHESEVLSGHFSKLKMTEECCVFSVWRRFCILATRQTCFAIYERNTPLIFPRWTKGSPRQMRYPNATTVVAWKVWKVQLLYCIVSVYHHAQCHDVYTDTSIRQLVVMDLRNDTVYAFSLTCDVFPSILA